jgi:hypothetical protein
VKRATRRWLLGRTPAPPEAFLPWLEQGDDVGGEDEGGPDDGEYDDPLERVRDLAAAGLQALGEADAGTGRDRKAAFRLLAADAFITYACEAALECAEPGREMERVLRTLAEGRN